MKRKRRKDNDAPVFEFHPGPVSGYHYEPFTPRSARPDVPPTTPIAPPSPAPLDPPGFHVRKLSDPLNKEDEREVREYLKHELGLDLTSPYEDLGRDIGKLVATKQQAYGDSFGKSGDVMRILYPDGIKPEQYDDALTVVRILDKLFRIATNKDALGESPYRDITGYGLLGAYKAEQG